MKIINLGATADNKSIFLNYDDTNVEYHLLETPNLVELVKEAVPIHCNCISKAGR